jgi:hypothetical protein
MEPVELCKSYLLEGPDMNVTSFVEWFFQTKELHTDELIEEFISIGKAKKIPSQVIEEFLKGVADPVDLRIESVQAAGEISRSSSDDASSANLANIVSQLPKDVLEGLASAVENQQRMNGINASDTRGRYSSCFASYVNSNMLLSDHYLLHNPLFYIVTLVKAFASCNPMGECHIVE